MSLASAACSRRLAAPPRLPTSRTVVPLRPRRWGLSTPTVLLRTAPARLCSQCPCIPISRLTARPSPRVRKRLRPAVSLSSRMRLPSLWLPLRPRLRRAARACAARRCRPTSPRRRPSWSRRQHRRRRRPHSACRAAPRRAARAPPRRPAARLGVRLCRRTTSPACSPPRRSRHPLPRATCWPSASPPSGRASRWPLRRCKAPTLW
mmetsp:Transcript_22228/g.71836  ORF Transcript_22228/g.71836 Transcript_22228/m.71836 type:complete len:206 (+) Transcript_22228:57-674(+)